MDNVIEKIAKFKVDCLKQAKKDADELESKLKEQIEMQVSEEMEEYNIRQELKFNTNMKKVEKDFHANCYLLESEANQKKIKKQEEIKEDFKNSLQTKIKQFIKSENYEEFLKNNIMITLNKVKIENNEYIFLYLTKTDKENYEESIKQKYPNIKIEIMEDNALGGCKCYDEKDKIFIDNTLKLAIDEQVENRRW